MVEGVGAAEERGVIVVLRGRGLRFDTREEVQFFFPVLHADVRGQHGWERYPIEI